LKKYFPRLLFSMIFFCGSFSYGAGVTSSDIVLDVTLNLSASQAWSLWIDDQKLEEWLTAKAHVEPRLHGHYELFWDPAHPHENSTIGCHITAIIPGKLLVFEWKGPVPYAELMNVSPLPTWVQISFEPVDSSNTVLHFRHSGWGQSPRWSEARTWQLNAWTEAFKNLR
jgi:uncharacterized protein YndB with AHSA1/START domain